MKYLKTYENIKPEKEVKYHKNGNIKTIEYKLNDIYHREDGPAYIEYYKNGQIRYKKYRLNGKLTRKDGPAYLSWYENGQIKSIYYLGSNRINKPSVIQWYENGIKSNEEYFKNVKKHREDGPAHIKYLKNGVINIEYYYIDGKLHREDGPAVLIWNNDSKTYDIDHYLNNRYYTYEDWLKKLKEINSPHYKEQQDIYDMEQNMIKYNL